MNQTLRGPNGELLTDMHMRILYILGEHDLRFPGVGMPREKLTEIATGELTTEELKRRYWALRDARTA